MPRIAQPRTEPSLKTWYKVCDRLAATIRTESEEAASLTSVETLEAVYPGLTSDDLRNMVEDGSYEDIKTIITSTGAEYVYSARYISNTYATLLARAAVNDPVATIGETVLDESRIYPRPTSLLLFSHPVFNIDRDLLKTYVDQVLSRYPDIRKLVASTGTIYLYSASYLSEGQAVSLMEWAEVERFVNH